MDVLIKKTVNIQNNFRKSPNRKYLRQTLIKKAIESRDLYHQLLGKLEFHPQGKLILGGVRNTYSEIKIFIDGRLDLDSNLPSFKTVAQTILSAIKIKNIFEATKMATILEVIKITSTLIPNYSGNPDKLESVVSALNALDTIVTDATRTAAINVVLSKLEGKARSAVGNAPQTINVIVQNLRDKCKNTQTSELLLAKLSATRQTGTLSNFTDEVEKLTTQLENIYLAQNIPDNTASKMAVKAGIKALCGGIKNTQTQLILKAGNFETLNAAIIKATENDTNTYDEHGNDNVNVFAMQNRFHNNLRGRGRGARNFSNNAHFPRENGYPQNLYQQGQYRGQTRYRNNWSSRGNFNPFGGRGRHRPPQHSMYVAQQENIENDEQQGQDDQQQQQQLSTPNQNHPLGVQFGQHTP